MGLVGPEEKEAVDLSADSLLWHLPGFLSTAEACAFFEVLHNEHPWPDSHYQAFGRRFVLPRQQTWHADTGIVYRYSDNLLPTQPWTPLLLHLRERIERATGSRFNAVLVNRYRHGADHVGWHSDDERELGAAPVIASLSLGASRFFCYRRKDNHAVTAACRLLHGELVVMAPAFQRDWQHAVPADDSTACRINLTFRYVYPA